MRKTALLLLLAGMACSAQVKKGKLVWEENFNGKTLDEKVWNFELGNGCPNICGWGNNERETYTKNNHRLENGHLVITTKKEGNLYTSTRITTAGKKEFQYGYMEARAKVATGQGIWPAFWMLGGNIAKVSWPAAGEIDILEYVGKDPGMVYTTLHTPSNHAGNALSKKTPFDKIEEGFHTFGVNWTKDAITFYVDDKAVYNYAPEIKNAETWPFDHPFYFIVNMAVGGYFGGPDVDDKIFPQEYWVDYIRVYSNE
jgi:beta-glucanase (GH16 family)